MNATLCCSNASACTLPAGDVLRLWHAACRSAIDWLHKRRAVHATWRELRLLDERSLSETGIMPGPYWPLDRTNRL